MGNGGPKRLKIQIPDRPGNNGSEVKGSLLHPGNNGAEEKGFSAYSDPLETIYPAQARADITAAIYANQKVFLHQSEKYSGQCPNCGGLERLVLRFTLGGPYKSARIDGVSMYTDEGWYIVDTRSYPCPVCSSKEALEQRLWELSGLELNEREWTTDFLAGKPGKEPAMEVVEGLLKKLPRPTGWVFFHGHFGTGKSGLLKSAVAACIRAGVPAHYTHAETILQHVRATYRNNGGNSSNGCASSGNPGSPPDDPRLSEKETQALNAYQSYLVLAVDEIDRTSNTHWAQATLMTLLDQRYVRRSTQCTLLASNLSPEQLPDSLGYLVSRIKDGERVYLGGVDLRGRG